MRNVACKQNYVMEGKQAHRSETHEPRINNMSQFVHGYLNREVYRADRLLCFIIQEKRGTKERGGLFCNPRENDLKEKYADNHLLVVKCTICEKPSKRLKRKNAEQKTGSPNVFSPRIIIITYYYGTEYTICGKGIATTSCSISPAEEICWRL